MLRRKGEEQEKGEAGIPFFQNPVFGTLLCGNTVCATLSWNLPTYKMYAHIQTTRTLGHNEYHGWELRWNKQIKIYISHSLSLSLYIYIYMNLIYNFYLSMSLTTAGSKAYDSGNVCQCTWQPSLVCPMERQRNERDRGAEWEIDCLISSFKETGGEKVSRDVQEESSHLSSNHVHVIPFCSQATSTCPVVVWTQFGGGWLK